MTFCRGLIVPHLHLTPKPKYRDSTAMVRRRPRGRPTDQILAVRPQRSLITRLSPAAMTREQQDAKVVRQRLKKLVKREDSTTYDIVWQDYATKYGPEA